MSRRILTLLAAIVMAAALTVPAARAQEVVVDESVTAGRTGCEATVKTGRIYLNIWAGTFSYSPGPSASADLSDCARISGE